jgi:hypothetical protein
MEPLRGSMLDLNTETIIDEIPPGFPNDPGYSKFEPRSGSINNSYVIAGCCLNRGAVPLIVNKKRCPL